MLYSSLNELAAVKRAKALELHKKAMQSRDPQVRSGLLRIADTYEKMATYLERKDPVVHLFQSAQTTQN
jgi:ribosomal protein S15P/S13E